MWYDVAMPATTSVEEVMRALSRCNDLPRVREHVNVLADDEAARRQRFYDDLRPGDKHEFIRGEVILPSPVRDAHGGAMFAIAYYLQTHLGPPIDFSRGKVGVDSRMIRFPRHDYHPDVCFWPPEVARTITRETTIHPVPTWITEVLSPATADRDRGVKFEDYAANGVVEYLIVDPDERTVGQYVSRDRRPYDLRRKLDAGQLASVAVDGFALDVAAVFA